MITTLRLARRPRSGSLSHTYVSPPTATMALEVRRLRCMQCPRVEPVSDGKRANLSKVAPAAYQALLALGGQVVEQAGAGGLDSLLVELVKMRTSQIDGRAFSSSCTPETPCGWVRRPIGWRCCRRGGRPRSFPTGALRPGVGGGRHAGGSRSGTRRGVRSRGLHLSESQIAAVCWLTVVTNALNRVAITSPHPVGS